MKRRHPQQAAAWKRHEQGPASIGQGRSEGADSVAIQPDHRAHRLCERSEAAQVVVSGDLARRFDGTSKALSAEVDTGSAQESARHNKGLERFRFDLNRAAGVHAGLLG